MIAAHKKKLILEPGRAAKNYWRDLFHYRELFLILAWRDVVVRYKQTTAGAAWALIQPLMSIVIFTVIFGKIAGLPLSALLGGAFSGEVKVLYALEK